MSHVFSWGECLLFLVCLFISCCDLLGDEDNMQWALDRRLHMLTIGCPNLKVSFPACIKRLTEQYAYNEVWLHNSCYLVTDHKFCACLVSVGKFIHRASLVPRSRSNPRRSTHIQSIQVTEPGQACHLLQLLIPNPKAREARTPFS